MSLYNQYYRVFIIILTAFIICLFLGTSLMHGDGSIFAPCQPDSMVYQAYAKSLAEGQPFRLGNSEQPTTGCTGHLYFLALVPAALAGLGIDELTDVSSLLGAILYLIFLLLFYRTADALYPTSAKASFLLVVFNGYIAFTALGQSDMTLFMVLSSASFVCALEKRYALLGISLFAAALARPEGMLLSFTWLVLSTIRSIDKRTDFKALLAGSAGIAGMFAAFAINFAVSEHLLFDSLNGKGLFLLSPIQALWVSAINGSEFISQVIFGICFKNSWRLWLWPPVIGGVLLLLGTLEAYSCENEEKRGIELWIIGSMAFQIVIIILSGWQSVAYDRYLAWIVPYMCLYQIVGSKRAAEKLNFPALHKLFTTALASWQIIGIAGFLPLYAETCRNMVEERTFCRNVEQIVPPNTKIGLYREYHFAAWFNKLVPITLAGIFSRDIPTDTPTTLEWLKWNAEKRFPLLILSGPRVGRWIECLAGKQIELLEPFESPHRLIPNLYFVNWEPFDAAINTSEVQLSPHIKLCDKLDVGYIPDEKLHEYKVFESSRGIEHQPFALIGELGDRFICEVGRAVTGWESFKVNLVPQKEAILIIRLATKACVQRNYSTESIELEMKCPTATILTISVDNNTLDPISFKIDYNKQFTEKIIKIPEKFITNSNTHLTIAGKYLSCCYRLYQ